MSGFTARHVRNLLTHADYLDSLPEEGFNMRTFYRPNGDVCVGFPAMATKKPECGTVACALGHAPSAGFKPKVDEDWGDYCIRIFGPLATMKVHIRCPDSGAWHYVFGGYWAVAEDPYDRTAKAAAQRMRRITKIIVRRMRSEAINARD